MKGDFSRSTFDPRKHYSGVRMQQGRVQLDADWNENLDILLRRIETETIDVIGKCGVPIHDAAFGVVTDLTTLSQEEQDWLTDHGFDTLPGGDFYLTKGRAYVDGIQVENDNTLPFSQQPFVLPPGQGLMEEEGIYWLYLDVWQRHITALEDPSIREVALGGPDTTTRMQTVWQAVLAKVGEQGDQISCADDLSPWPEASKGRLRARTHPEDQPDDPCVVPPGAGYKRLENQLYRVEIHRDSNASGGPTFKWSRDNGSVVVAIAEFAVDGANDKIRTTSLGRDDVLGLHENDWVEVLDDATELAGLPGTLAQITKIDPDNILTLSLPVSGYDLNGHPKVRRWDSDGEIAVTVPATNDGYIKIEDGIEIKFEIDTLHTGDYWLIPARTVPGQFGDIEWPKDGSDPAALLPFGIQHHYCTLAVITFDGETIVDVDDCREKFPPLTELPVGGQCCCSVSVGQGGDHPDIESALAARPADAMEWRICLLAGEHKLNTTITVNGALGLTISGCGRQTRVIAPQGKPAFVFTNGNGIQLDSLWLEASTQDGALVFSETEAIVIENNVLTNILTPTSPNLTGAAKQKLGTPGLLILIKNCEQVAIRDNDLVGLPAVMASARDISIIRNRIRGGGIQIVPPSLIVQIEDNMILQGAGPGIRLGADNIAADSATWVSKEGSASAEVKARSALAGIRLTTIRLNLIAQMTGSGIVTQTVLKDLAQMSDVEFLTISDNQIISCCNQPDVLLSDRTRVGGGIALMAVFSLQITDNFIAANGQGKAPACGVFVLDGSDIVVDGNVIVENGVVGDKDEPDAYQAGIAAHFVFANAPGTFAANTGLKGMGMTGYPALRVHGNEVICPAAQALTVSALGSVAIDGNTLVSRESQKQPTVPLNFGEKGRCVAILDLGLPLWLPELIVLLQMMASGQTNIHLEGAEMVNPYFANFPDGRVLFHNNQVTYNTEQQEEVTSLGKIDAQWFKRAWDAAFFSVLFISLDDISLNGNQFQAAVPPYVLEGLQKYQAGEIAAEELWAYLLKFIHVGSSALTVRATSNGLTERIFSNYVSYVSNAMAMNLTTSNEATHLFVASAPKKADANNLSLIP
ncbi:MAG: hypothetical protein JW730_18850 [Anaerolineales bacterium]|nr:hypothetical protein [Anaerolineales bacterium]